MSLFCLSCIIIGGSNFTQVSGSFHFQSEEGFAVTGCDGCLQQKYHSDRRHTLPFLFSEDPIFNSKNHQIINTYWIVLSSPIQKTGAILLETRQPCVKHVHRTLGICTCQLRSWLFSDSFSSIRFIQQHSLHSLGIEIQLNIVSHSSPPSCFVLSTDA
jgi:hypothetical protein